MTCTNPQGLCDSASQPVHQEVCEDYTKCYEWKTGDWSKVLTHTHTFTPAYTYIHIYTHTSTHTLTLAAGFQCSSSCGRGLQSRVVQCMHRVTGRHGNDCPSGQKPLAYRQCHQGACNEKINTNTITSPRLGKGAWSC